MEYVIFIARSVTQAQRMMRTLEAEFGCSYAVKIRKDKLGQAMDCLRQGGLAPLSVHEKTESGYREVRA